MLSPSWWRAFPRGKAEPRDGLTAALRQFNGGGVEYRAVVESAGYDYTQLLVLAESLASGMAASAARDLSPRRQQRLAEYGRALVVMGFVLATLAGEEG